MREIKSLVKKTEKYYNFGSLLLYDNNKIIFQTSPMIATFIGIFGTLLFCYISKKYFS